MSAQPAWSHPAEGEIAFPWHWDPDASRHTKRIEYRPPIDHRQPMPEDMRARGPIRRIPVLPTLRMDVSFVTDPISPDTLSAWTGGYDFREERCQETVYLVTSSWHWLPVEDADAPA